MMTKNDLLCLMTEATARQDWTARLVLADHLEDLGRDDEAELLRDETRSVLLLDSRIVPFTAADYLSMHDDVVIRYASQGSPAGEDIAWLGENELPFTMLSQDEDGTLVLALDLNEVEGVLREDGTFEATNLNDGSGAHGWWVGNYVYGLWLRRDPDVWQEQWEELMGDPEEDEEMED